MTCFDTMTIFVFLNCFKFMENNSFTFFVIDMVKYKSEVLVRPKKKKSFATVYLFTKQFWGDCLSPLTNVNVQHAKCTCNLNSAVSGITQA